MKIPLILIALASMALCETRPAPTQPTVEVQNLLGETSRIYDSDKDGWDDVWCMIFKQVKHRDRVTDTDGDGTSDYQEMLLWRNPITKGPPPRKPTAEDIAAAATAQKEYQVATEEKWALNRAVIAGMKADQAKRLTTKTEHDAREKVRKAELEKLRLHIEKNRADWLKWREANPDAVVPPNQIQTMDGDQPSIMRMIPMGLSEMSYSVDAPELYPFDPPWPDKINLTGAGVTVGVLEFQPPYSDTLLNDKFSLNSWSGPTEPRSIHATAVTGIICALDNEPQTPYSKGVGYGAFAELFRVGTDPAAAMYTASAFNNYKIDTVNASVGLYMGWGSGDSVDTYLGKPYWAGNVSLSPYESCLSGSYNSLSMSVDWMVTNVKTCLPVVSAGNAMARPSVISTNTQFYTVGANKQMVLHQPGDFIPFDLGVFDGGYDTINAGWATAKNVLTVGNAAGNPIAPVSSGKGPTDDGRIKPDLVVDGGTGTLSGLSSVTFTTSTSNSTAGVSGGLALIDEMTQQTRRKGLLASTKKGLAIHCAYDIPPAGPDYATGWGAFQVGPMAQLIKEDDKHPGHQHIGEVTMKDNVAISFVVRVGSPPPAPTPAPGDPEPVIAPGEPLKVTICWSDPHGIPGFLNQEFAVIDDPELELVNDFFFEIRKLPDYDGPGTPSSPHQPWVLNPLDKGAAAGTGVNVRDNVKQIVIPWDPGVYLVEIWGRQTETTQDLSIIVSGNTPFTEEDAATLKLIKGYLDTQPDITGYFPPFGMNGGFIQANESSFSSIWSVNPFVLNTLQHSTNLTHWTDNPAGATYGGGQVVYDNMFGNGMIGEFFRLKQEEKGHYKPPGN